MGDVDFEQELVRTFILSGNDELKNIRSALTNNDLQGIRRGAHCVKGASAGIRADRVNAAAARLEAAAQPGGNESLANLFDELALAIEQAIAHLRVHHAA